MGNEMKRFGITHRRPDFSVEGSGKLFETTSKRALWIALKHLCAKDTGEYDAALEDGRWLSHMVEELQNTKGCE
jgi:hypothetical protein